MTKLSKLEAFCQAVEAHQAWAEHCPHAAGFSMKIAAVDLISLAADIRKLLQCHTVAPAPNVVDWISWNGGEIQGARPVPASTFVRVKFRDGSEAPGSSMAGGFRWDHTDPSGIGHGADIVAYRVVS